MTPEPVQIDSGTTPEGRRNDSALIRREERGERSTPSLPTSTTDEGRQEGAIQSLIDRGVRPQNAPLLAADWPAKRIEDAVAWFDQQTGVGAGVLVAAIREGRRAASRELSSVERNRLYAEQVCDWLNEHFANLRQASGYPHPAAITCVFRLHYRDGKGSLTKARHGEEIRAAVQAFDERFPSVADPAGGRSS